MRVIGLLGGMSWESTAEYYRLINQGVKEKLGGLHSAKVILYSVDFEEIEELQRNGDWRKATEIMIDGARRVQAGGAECLVICTNTMHKMADAVADAIGIPLIHIADATAEKIKAQGMRRIGLLGTRYTMEEDFYRGRLENTHALTVLVPREAERSVVHRVIYEELCNGIQNESSRQCYRQIIHDLVSEGAEGIILGCTEIGLLITEADSTAPLFDTTTIHAEAAVEWSLQVRL